MKKFFIALFITALVTGMWMKGSFGHRLSVGLGASIVLPVMLALVGLWMFKMRGGRQIAKNLKCALVCTLGISVALLLSLGIGIGIHKWEIYRARKFVDSVLPKLDAYYERSGAYPTELKQLAAAPPRWFSPEVTYTSDGSSFDFVYWDDAAILDGYIYNDTIRTWIRFD